MSMLVHAYGEDVPQPCCESGLNKCAIANGVPTSIFKEKCSKALKWPSKMHNHPPALLGVCRLC